MAAYITLGVIIFIFGFLLYLLIDLARTKNGLNEFFNKWTRKTLWMWLPFYALWRLTRDVVLGKGKK